MPRRAATSPVELVLPDYWIPGKDAAFLHFLLKNPADMRATYGGNRTKAHKL